jgi:membrane protease YdiL (CAAX protease family)
MEATIDTREIDLTQRRFWAIAEIVVGCLIAVGVLAAAGSLGGQDPLRHGIAVAIAETLIITMIWWSQRRRGLTLADLGLTFGMPDLRTVGRTVGWSVVVFAGTAVLLLGFAMTMSLVAGEPQAADVSAYDYLRGDLWAALGTIAAVWVTASFAEEVIHRGFLIHRLEEAFAGARHVVPTAVVVGGLIFGAIHYSWGLAGMMQTAVMGMALGTAYVKLGRRLWIVILVHGYLDTLLFVQIYFVGATGV